MRSSKRKTVKNTSNKKVLTSAPILFILVLLLVLFLIDLYGVVHSSKKKHKQHENEHMDKKSYSIDGKQMLYSAKSGH